MLYNITSPRPWGGGAQIIEDVFEDAQLFENSRSEKTSMEGTLAGRHSRTSDERHFVGKSFVARVDVAGSQCKPPRFFFLLSPKNVTSERPSAFLPSQIRWWESLRAPDVQERKKRSRVR